MKWIEIPDAALNEKVLINSEEISHVLEANGHGRLVMSNGHIFNFLNWSYANLAAQVKNSWLSS